MKRIEEFLVDYIVDVMRKNEGKRVILKNGRTLTCINENRTQRYAVGKGKEGKFISIKSLYDYLNGKKIESYCVLENDSKINLHTDEVKTLNFIKMPTEKDYDKYIEDEKKSRERQYIKTDMELWTKRLNNRINEGELITGYKIKDDDINYKSVILNIVDNEGEATLYMGAKSEEHLRMILNLVVPLITERIEIEEDNTKDGEKFYIKKTNGYEEVKGYRLNNKYNFELFYNKSNCGNYVITHLPTGIAIGDSTTGDKDNLLKKIDELVKKHGESKVIEMFNNAIETHGTVPNYSATTEEVATDKEVVVDDDKTNMTSVDMNDNEILYSESIQEMKDLATRHLENKSSAKGRYIDDDDIKQEIEVLKSLQNSLEDDNLKRLFSSDFIRVNDEGFNIIYNELKRDFNIGVSTE